MIEGRNKFARITCRACGAMCPEENWNRRAALAAQPAEPVAIGRVLSEEEMGVGWDRKSGDVIWWAKPKGPAMLYAAQPAPAAVPPGYALVPIEPTQKMEYEFRAGAGPHDRWFKPAYRAMIAAAGDTPFAL